MSRKNLFASGFELRPAENGSFIIAQGDSEMYASRCVPNRFGFSDLPDLILFLKREAEQHTDPQFDFREQLSPKATLTPQGVVSET